MFLWTMWVQVALGFLLLPLQSLPTLGDLSLDSLPEVFLQGLRCTLTGRDANATLSDGSRVVLPPCTWVEPALMFSYIAVDFSQYTLGLYVIQNGGANLMQLASAVALPLASFVWVIKPLVGRFYDPLSLEKGLGVALTLLGFIGYFYKEHAKAHYES